MVIDTFPSIGRVRVKHRGILLMLKGTVIRSGAVKMYEGERMYQCRKCKHMYVFYYLCEILCSVLLCLNETELVCYVARFPLFPELESINSIVKPPFCPSQVCYVVSHFILLLAILLPTSYVLRRHLCSYRFEVEMFFTSWW